MEVCNAVLDIMEPTPDRPMIINLPVTVEMSMPHVYANQIEYCDKHLKYRDSVIISTHPHNDRGTRRGLTPSWRCWQVPSGWSAACSATASAPATWTP